jgi:hypothetical protein
VDSRANGIYNSGSALQEASETYPNKTLHSRDNIIIIDPWKEEDNNQPASVIQGNEVEPEQMQGVTAIKVGSRLARPSFPLRLRPPKTKTPPPNEPSIGSRGDDKVTNQPASHSGSPPLPQHPNPPMAAPGDEVATPQRASCSRVTTVAPLNQQDEKKEGSAREYHLPRSKSKDRDNMIAYNGARIIHDNESHPSSAHRNGHPLVSPNVQPD